MYKMIGIGLLVVIIYYAAFILAAGVVIDSVQKESEKCGGIAKCSGEAIGLFMNNFNSGLEKGKE